jgi:SOS-response transcriptional repressor LexA
MTESMARRIAQRLHELDMSAREASLRTTGKPDFLRPVLAGARPRSDNLEKLAAVLQTTTDWLLTGVGDIQRSELFSLVPLITWVSAGRMSFPDISDDIIRMIEESRLDPSGDWIALKVSGDSMDRISPPDSIIFVDRNDKVLVPNACYVISNGDGEATYKRFRPSPMRFEPVSTNPAHEPIYPAREPLVVGRVKRSILDM